ncbi:MAG TPA: AMP-binding protein [Candidatus Woesebacteria bacterium]|nr:AMP-binding protein [Candidatus Woesebacteria bacterium]HNS94599.1 AMP-binding protein [Candidatus Woesebacteria bacterium]
MSNSSVHTQPTVADFVESVASAYPDRIAFEIRRRVVRERVLYKDIPDRMVSIAQFLIAHGVQPGDKVLIWAFNCPEYALLLLTLFAYGFVAVPIDHRTGAATLTRIIEQTKPTALFHSRFINHAPIAQQFSHTWMLEDLFALIKANIGPKVTPQKALDVQALCQVVYTSGTTGIPKGVMLSQNNMLKNLQALYPLIPEKHLHHRTISVLPLSHMFEQIIGLFAALSMGAQVTYMTRVNSFQLRKSMQDVKPTYLALVPQLMAVFWRRIEDQAAEQGKGALLQKLLSVASYMPRFIRRIIFARIHHVFGGHLRFIGCGGAPMNYHVGRNFVAMGIQILEGYGATEVTAIATINDGTHGVGNVGTAVQGVEVTLDAQGQILIKSPCVSLGYYDNEEKTKAVFHEGWYRTGDIGALDAHGVLRVVGRDFFKIVLASGEKVFVEDVERIATKHNAIKDLCVFGLPGEKADIVHAVLIPKDRNHFDGSAIVREINSLLESKQQIMSHSLWDGEDFPRTATLKLDRKAIKDVVSGVLDRDDMRVDSNQANTSPYDVIDILSRISSIDKSKIQDTDLLTSDLGLDSIDRGELVASIEEHLGTIIDATRIDAKTTVLDVKHMMTDSAQVQSTQSDNTWHFTWWGELIRLVFQYVVTFPLHVLFVKLKVRWPQSLQRIPEGTLIVVNHVGVLDVACVWRLLGPQAVKSISLARSTFWDNRVMGKVIELLSGGLPLDQTGTTMIPFLARAWDLLAGGRYLIMFPQGRLQRAKTQDRFKMGVGFVAKELGCPVVPIKLVGYEDVWPAPQVLFQDIATMLPKKRGTVVALVGEPVQYDSTESATQITRKIEEAFDTLHP